LRLFPIGKSSVGVFTLRKLLGKVIPAQTLGTPGG